MATNPVTITGMNTNSPPAPQQHHFQDDHSGDQAGRTLPSRHGRHGRPKPKQPALAEYHGERRDQQN